MVIVVAEVPANQSQLLAVMLAGSGFLLVRNGEHLVQLQSCCSAGKGTASHATHARDIGCEMRHAKVAISSSQTDFPQVAHRFQAAF